MKNAGRGAKAKGNKFQRTVAKMVIKAGQCIGLKKNDCYSTPMSGGHPTAALKADLVLSHKVRKVMPASVECKHHRRVDLQWFYTKQGLVFKWIDQAKRDAAGKY